MMSKMQPRWPQVRCHYCGWESHWRQMVTKEQVLHIQETKYDTEDQWHLCVRCEAWWTGKTEAAVRDTAFKRPIERKKLRVERYQEVRKKHSQKRQVLCHVGRKMLLRAEFQAMFQPLMEYIELKRKALAFVEKDVERHNDLQQRLKESSSFQEDEEIYQAMSQLEQDDKYIAYKSKGKAQHSYIRASSYHDEWVKSAAGFFVAFFICLANTRWDRRAQCYSKCRRIIPSKKWRKKKDDTVEEWVPKQKWYCWCHAKYKAPWGQVVCIRTPDGAISYVRAPVPSWDIEDIRAMKTEKTVSAKSVKELHNKIRSIEPPEDDIVGLDSEGYHYIKNLEDFQAMPKFTLDELLTLQKMQPSRL